MYSIYVSANADCGRYDQWYGQCPLPGKPTTGMFESRILDVNGDWDECCANMPLPGTDIKGYRILTSECQRRGLFGWGGIYKMAHVTCNV